MVGSNAVGFPDGVFTALRQTRPDLSDDDFHEALRAWQAKCANTARDPLASFKAWLAKWRSAGPRQVALVGPAGFFTADARRRWPETARRLAERHPLLTAEELKEWPPAVAGFADALEQAARLVGDLVVDQEGACEVGAALDEALDGSRVKEAFAVAAWAVSTLARLLTEHVAREAAIGGEGTYVPAGPVNPSWWLAQWKRAQDSILEELDRLADAPRAAGPPGPRSTSEEA